MVMPTGLEKLTVEVPFVKGQLQKFAQEVTEMEAPYYLRNVDLRKASAPAKRNGFTAKTANTEGAVSMPTTAKRIVSVDDELVAITQTTGSIGSGGGSGGSGDTVFAFAETIQKWRAFGKIQRPTMDVIFPIAAHRETVGDIDCCVNGRYMLTAERTILAPLDVIFITITDLESGTERAKTTIAGAAADVLIKCVATSSWLCVLWYDSNAGALKVTRYNPTTLTPTTTSLTVDPTAANAQKCDVAASGDDLFVSYVRSNTTVAIKKLNTNTGTVSSEAVVETTAAGTHRSTAIDVAFGEICVIYSAPNTGDLKVRSTTDTTPAFTGTAVTVASAVNAADARILICSASERLAFFRLNYNSATETAYTGGNLIGSGTPAQIKWGRIEGTHTTLALGWGSSLRAAIGLSFWGQPFLLNSRAFLPVVAPRHNQLNGVHYKGAYITEVEITISSSQATLMPHAACGLDATGSEQGRNVSVVSSKAYIAGTRLLIDPLDPHAKRSYTEVHQALVNIFDFADDYRWKPAVHNHMVIFSGAYPYLYDGQYTHECGFAWRPEIIGYVEDTGGSLNGSETYDFRVTFEWRAHDGRRWMSQPSYLVESDSVSDQNGTDLQLKFSVAPCTLNMMQDASFYFPGKLYAVLWRATAAQAAAGVYVRDSQVEFHPFDTANIVLTASTADADIARSERMYIVGGELENYTAPPCRSVVQHRDRLVAFNTEWKTLDYTKPIQQDRGIEWSLSQRVPCPEDIVALESLEHVLVAFSKHKIYALEGAGPSSTGVPPDAFARLVLVNADIGCSETNAAWRCPAGIIFRSEGGFWLLDRGMGVSYLGAPVEGDFDELSLGNDMRTLNGVLDEKKNCMRIYVRGQLDDVVVSDGFSSNLARFNYWFDTGRWSVDTLQSTSPEWACYHRGLNHVVWGAQSLSGIAYEDTSVYDDLSNFYPEIVESAWIRFGDLVSFKRVWRTLVSLEEMTNNVSSLKVIVSADFGAPINSETITGSDFGASAAKLVRIHLFRQKVRAVKVQLAESVGSATNSPGFKFHGIGFELGMKRGAFKAATVSR